MLIEAVRSYPCLSHRPNCLYSRYLTKFVLGLEIVRKEMDREIEGERRMRQQRQRTEAKKLFYVDYCVL